MEQLLERHNVWMEKFSDKKISESFSVQKFLLLMYSLYFATNQTSVKILNYEYFRQLFGIPFEQWKFTISDHILHGFVKERYVSENNLYKRDLRNVNDREFEDLVINGHDWDGIYYLEKRDPNYSCKNSLICLIFT